MDSNKTQPSTLKLVEAGSWICNGCCKEFFLKNQKPHMVKIDDHTPDVWYCLDCYMRTQE